MKKRKGKVFIFIVGLGDSKYSVKAFFDFISENNLGKTVFREVKPTKKLRFKGRASVAYDALVEYTKAGYDVILVGNSAGALACLVAASKLYRWHKRLNKQLKGVIVLSPATPLWINPLGWPLVKSVWRYVPKMISGNLIYMRDKDYDHIALNGVPPEVKEELQRAKLPISGKEANKLAGILWPRPWLGKLDVDVLFVCGGADNWVNPKAHNKLYKRLRYTTNSGTTGMSKWSGLGHLLTHSDKGGEIARDAFEWFDNPKGIIVVDPR